MELCLRSLESIATPFECAGSVDFQVAIGHQTPQVGVLLDYDRIVFESYHHMQHLRPNSRCPRFVASLGLRVQNRYYTKSVLMALEEKFSSPCLAAWSLSDSGLCPIL